MKRRYKPQEIPRGQHQILGVRFPSWLPVYDCRWPEDLPIPKSPAGYTMYGSERAEWAMGLQDHCVTPRSTTTTDTRYHTWVDCSREALLDVIAEATKMKLSYEFLTANPSTDAGLGGYRKYMPKGVAVANFGISIIADCRDYVVEYFQPWE